MERKQKAGVIVSSSRKLLKRNHTTCRRIAIKYREQICQRAVPMFDTNKYGTERRTQSF
jgi:hypothetical protein